MNDVRITGNARNRQIVIAKCLADFNALVLCDLPRAQINIFEMHVQLDRIEVKCTDFLAVSSSE